MRIHITTPAHPLPAAIALVAGCFHAPLRLALALIWRDRLSVPALNRAIATMTITAMRWLLVSLHQEENGT
jgi:hypothetical protein